MWGWVKLALSRYAEFSGRSRRKEYWYFVLFVFLGSIAASVLDVVLGTGGTFDGYSDRTAWQLSTGFHSSGGILTAIFALAMLIPSLAAAVRRLHDGDRSGWWLLIAFIPLIGTIVLLVFMILEGSRGSNRFGPDPLAGEG